MSTATYEAATLMTVEQFAQLQTGETEDYELVEGKLSALPSGTPLHVALRDQAGDILRTYFKRTRTGRAFAELDCRLSGRTVRRPDLSVFLGERARQLDMTAVPVPFAPDIAIEVLSASESAIDVNRKALDYLAAGTKEVWLLDNSNGEIFIQTPTDIRPRRGTDLVESPLLPGFFHPVNDFLAISETV